MTDHGILVLSLKFIGYLDEKLCSLRVSLNSISKGLLSPAQLNYLKSASFCHIMQFFSILGRVYKFQNSIIRVHQFFESADDAAGADKRLRPESGRQIYFVKSHLNFLITPFSYFLGVKNTIHGVGQGNGKF